MNHSPLTTNKHKEIKPIISDQIFNQFFAQNADLRYDDLGGFAMNLGHVDPELEKFLNEYKKYGYATRTEMANEAFRWFKQMKAKQKREQWRQDAFEELKKEKPDRVFENIDGEDFV